MRGATECARRLKRFLKSLKGGKAAKLPADDPVTQLILGVFSRDMPEIKAREVLERMRGFVVDYNELRVTSPREMAEYIGDYPGAWTKCEDLSRALNKVFAMQHTVTLDHLIGKSRKEARDYLGKLEGLDAYSRARVCAYGLQHHAIPLDEAMWAHARKLHIVDPKATLDEAQSFLERYVDEEDAPEFLSAFRKQAWSECGGAVRSGQAEKIHSIPPKRASKNMLRPILSSGEYEDGPRVVEVGKKAPVHRKRGAAVAAAGRNKLAAPAAKIAPVPQVKAAAPAGRMSPPARKAPAAAAKPADTRRVRSASRKKAKSA